MGLLKSRLSFIESSASCLKNLFYGQSVNGLSGAVCLCWQPKKEATKTGQPCGSGVKVLKEKRFLFTREGECMNCTQVTRPLFAPATTSTALFEGPQYKT